LIAPDIPVRWFKAVGLHSPTNRKAIKHTLKKRNDLLFITTTIVNWIPVFQKDCYFNLIIDSLKYCQKHKGLKVHGYVIMPTLLGYDSSRTWGHITSGGTVANYEGLWVARNLKSIPGAIKEVKPEWVDGMDDWQLMKLPPSRILDLVDLAKDNSVMDLVLAKSVRGRGPKSSPMGKVLVPQSKHYSWVKAADILGIGQENLVVHTGQGQLPHGCRSS
jgi:hypothetical protein